METFNGAVEISGWDQNTVDVSGTKYGPTQEAADNLEIRVDQSPSSVSLRAVRPPDLRGNRGARFVIKSAHPVLDRITSSNGPIRIQDGAGPARLRTSNGGIHVQAFRGNVDAQTSNGPIELADVDGDAIAHTSNGHLRVERLRGLLQGSTSNGGITANLDRAKGPVRVDTNNGSIDLSVPAAYSNDIHATTSNSGIAVHLPPTSVPAFPRAPAMPRFLPISK